MRKLFLATAMAALAACAQTQTPAQGEPTAQTVGAYVARGNEPFWRLEADGAGARWIAPEGEITADAAPIPAPTPTVPGWRGFSARFGGRALTAEVTPGPCQDDMSGQYYPDAVRVRFGNETFEGCGGDPLALLTGEWRAFLGDDEIGTLRIDPDSTLSGSAGCNRLMGAQTITGEGISIGPIGSTRMACAPEVMARERALIGVLEGAIGFEVGVQGAVRLLGPEGEVLTLRRP